MHKMRASLLLIVSLLLINLVVITSSGYSQTQAYNWKQVKIKGGGFVSGIITHPACQNLIYARTDVGGAYRWDETSSSWIPLMNWVSNTEWSLLGIESIALDPSDTTLLYIAAGMYTNNWTSLNGAILRSTNQGSTFQRTNLPFKMGGNEDGRSIGERLAVDPNKGSILYFGTRTSGLWMSTDSSLSWSKVTSFPVTGKPNGVGIGWVIFDPRSSSIGYSSKTIYIGVADTTGSSLYRSTDSGTTWAAVSGQPGPNLIPHHAVLNSNGILYLAYCNGPGPNGISSGAVWKYDTNLSSWTNITPPTGQGGFAGLSVDGSNPNILIVSTLDRWWPHDEFYRSTNGGSSWIEVWGQSANKSVFDTTSAPYTSTCNPHWTGDIKIDPFNSNRAFFITGYGIYRSTNLAALDSNSNSITHWDFFNEGLEETVVSGLVSPPSGPHLLSTIYDIDGFKHDNLDISPAGGRYSPPIGSNTGLDFSENKPNLVVRVGGSGSYGYYSINTGISWTGFSTRPTVASGGSIAISSNGTRIVWSPDNGTMAYSTNTGVSWTNSVIGTTGLRPISDRVNNNKFYAYNSGSGGTVYISTDGGANFTTATTGFSWGSSLAVVPGLEGNLWLSRSWDGLYRSTNSGSSFSKINSVQEAYQVSFGKPTTGQTHPAVFLFGIVNNVLGFFRSDDIGTSWIRINDDLHQYGPVMVICGDPKTFGRFYVGINGLGILYGDPIDIPVKIELVEFVVDND